MKNIGIILVLLSLLSCETKYNYIDSGLADGRFDGTIYDYLRSNSYDWDSTLLLVERAGLEGLFQGKQTGYEKITFWGPTNLSVLRWMIEQGYNAIREIPEATCRELILRHVVAGIHWKGGEVFTSAWGTKFWVYSFQDTYHDIPDVGPVYLYVTSLDTRVQIDVASTNIETDNGVVHALNYSYTFGQL